MDWNSARFDALKTFFQQMCVSRDTLRGTPLRGAGATPPPPMSHRHAPTRSDRSARPAAANSAFKQMPLRECLIQMVRVSPKKLLEKQFFRGFRRALYYSDSSDEEDFGSTLAALVSSRYLERPRGYAVQHNCAQLQCLLRQRRDFFRHQTRMCQETFLAFLDLISDDPIRFYNTPSEKTVRE